MWENFEEWDIPVQDVVLHGRSGGHGPAVVLLHEHPGRTPLGTALRRAWWTPGLRWSAGTCVGTAGPPSQSWNQAMRTTATGSWQGCRHPRSPREFVRSWLVRRRLCSNPETFTFGSPLLSTSRVLGGRYEVGELIGRGSMGDVYLGQDTILGRRVAIQMLRRGRAADDSFLQRFHREARWAASLNHPSIVAIFDTGD